MSPKHFRVQAIFLRSENSKVLIINSYLYLNSHITDDLEDILASIETALVTNDYTHVFLTGDINYNMLKQTMHVKNVSIDMCLRSVFIMKQICIMH